MSLISILSKQLGKRGFPEPSTMEVVPSLLYVSALAAGVYSHFLSILQNY